MISFLFFIDITFVGGTTQAITLVQKNGHHFSVSWADFQLQFQTSKALPSLLTFAFSLSSKGTHFSGILWAGCGVDTAEQTMAILLPTAFHAAEEEMLSITVHIWAVGSC